MFAAWLMAFGKTVAAAVLNTGAGRQSNQTGSGAGTTGPAGAFQTGGVWESYAYDDALAQCTALIATDGSVTVSSSSGDPVVDSDYFLPVTPGIGSSCWLSYSVTGSGGTITGGLVAGTRYAMTSSRSPGLRNTSSGTATRVFTFSFHDAASGGSLLGTHTFTATAEIV